MRKSTIASSTVPVFALTVAGRTAAPSPSAAALLVTRPWTRSRGLFAARALVIYSCVVLGAACTSVPFQKLLGNGKQLGWAVRQTVDGGYVIVGEDDSSPTPEQPSAYVLKTDLDGNEEWEKTWPGEGFVQLFHVHQ